MRAKSIERVHTRSEGKRGLTFKASLALRAACDVDGLLYYFFSDGCRRLPVRHGPIKERDALGQRGIQMLEVAVFILNGQKALVMLCINSASCAFEFALARAPCHITGPGPNSLRSLKCRVRSAPSAS